MDSSFDLIKELSSVIFKSIEILIVDIFCDIIWAFGVSVKATPALIDLLPLDISTSFISVPSIYLIASIEYSIYPELEGAVVSSNSNSIVLPSLNM